MKFTVEQEQPVRAFSRASVAYKDGVEYAVDTMRETNGLLVSTSDGVLVDDAGEGGIRVTPHCVAGGKLYGIDYDYRVNVSTDGQTWSRVASTTTMRGLWSTPNGNLFGIDTSRQIWYRSDDEGATFVAVTPTGDNAPSASHEALVQSVHSYGSTMMFAEYGPQATVHGGRYIFRSTDDGATWEKVFDADTLTSESGNKIYHWHVIGYHAASGRWIACAGDDQARRWNVYSDDNGDTWTAYNAANTLHNQPIRFVDTGDDDWLVFGDDGVVTLGKFNARTGEIITTYQHADRTLLIYVFNLMVHAGVIYAFLTRNVDDYYTVAVLVSIDGDNWAVYHQFAASESVTGSASGGVYFNGKIHWEARRNNSAASAAHFSHSPAVVRPTSAAMLSGAHANLMDENESSIETSVGSWTTNSGQTKEKSNDYSVHGDYAVKCTFAAAGTHAIRWAGDLTLVAGKSYVGMLRVRANKHCRIRPRLRYRSEDGSVQKDLGNTPYYVIGDDWLEVYTIPAEVPVGETEYYRWEIGVDASQDDTVVYVDTAQIIEVPNRPWQIGGTAKSADVLTETVTPGKLWSDVFALQALYLIDHYAADDQLTIKTWALDANNKIDIVYDPSDAKIKLIRTIAGSAQTAVASTAQYWNGAACLKFVLRVSSDAVKLDIENGRAIETLSDDGMSALLDAEIVGTYGDFPMVVLTGWQQARFIPLWIADADVVKVFNLEIPDYAQRGGVEMAGFISGRGFVS